jgi:hypothetical protein
MGGQISIHCGCCSGKTEGHENFDEEVEDKFTVGENVQNTDDVPHMKMPALIQQQALFPRSLSETTTIPAR